MATVLVVSATMLYANHRRDVVLWTADQLPTPPGFPSRAAFSGPGKNITVEIQYGCPKRRDNGQEVVQVREIQQAWEIAKQNRPNCQSYFKVVE